MRRFAILAGASLLSGLLLAAPVLADSNLLRNPNLEQGSGDQPSAWRTQRLTPGGGSFAWARKPKLDSELQITNSNFDIAQWSQPITLQPGWYRLTGEVESHGDGARPILGVGVSHSVKGWSSSGTPVPTLGGFYFGEFYFKVEETREVRVVCRLSGRGSAQFRHLALTKMRAAPGSGALQADLGEVQPRHAANQVQFNARPFDRPTGHLWTEIALLAGFAAVFTWGWRQLRLPTAGRRN